MSHIVSGAVLVTQSVLVGEGGEYMVEHKNFGERQMVLIHRSSSPAL